MLRNPTNNFKLKKCLFGTAKLVRNTIKKKFTHNCGGIAFDGEGSWSFDNGYARYVVIFGVDNSSSSHIDACKKNFLLLAEGLTQCINGSSVAAEK